MLRRALLLLAVGGLLAGFLLPADSGRLSQDLVWTAATLPLVLTLAVSIVRDFWIGRFGVDAIALVSMSAALLLDQALAAVVVAIMYAGGSVLEDFARGRAERNLKALTDRSPRFARRLAGGKLEEIPADEVAVGDELLVRAGEVLPVDGVLLDEHASIDAAAVTGEPLPERCRLGDVLLSGTVNAAESFRMRATAIAGESTYAGIVRMVQAAQTAKAPFMRMADRFALLLLPATLIIAAAAWLGSGDPIRALAVLVVATPCPLILAAPVAFISGVSRAARAGVLMKGSAALEALAQTKTVIFDKTGTLTHGGAGLLEIEAAPGRDGDEVLRLLGSLEQASGNVVALAAVEAARSHALALSPPREVKESRGSGLQGIVDGVRVIAGSRAFVCGTEPLPLWAEKTIKRYEGQPVLTVYLSANGMLVGIFVFGDGVRADAHATIAALRRNGIGRAVMLTGDDEAAAARVAAPLGLDRVLAGATPSGKVDVVREERASAPTLMVGDGINDAPALAAATVGIAMGARGATASSQAADIVILTDSLKPVAEAVAIARRTRAIAYQSVVTGLALSGIAMLFAAFGYVTPVAGALLQEGIDVAVIVNALRALRGGVGQSSFDANQGRMRQPA
ncbi:heavy metal translocating P-type ATPase [Aquibium oceanicum]|uniref:heavy metal translocating P-type ATPase n=1 Tax=Aquibium oceanicum TaxID=1670800 RepID=UPI0030024CE3